MMTTFIDISHMQQLVRKTGVQQFITELTGFIEDDYRSRLIFRNAHVSQIIQRWALLN